MIESTETPKRTEALLDAYKAKDEVETVLDPKAIDKSTLDKLPTPTGYRILVLPFAGPKKTKGGIWLSDTTQETIQMTTVCGFVLNPQSRNELGISVFCKTCITNHQVVVFL